MMLGLGAAVELRCPEGYAPLQTVTAQGSAGHSAPYGGHSGTCYKYDTYQWETGEATDSPRHTAWLAARPPDVPALNWDEFKASWDAWCPDCILGMKPITLAMAAAGVGVVAYLVWGRK